MHESWIERRIVGTVPSVPDHDEAEELTAAAAGNRQAFDRLVGRALPQLRTTLRRIVGHPEETEDLVQDTLAKAWNSISTFQARSAFSTWLCRIGINVAIDFLRAEKRWRERAQIAYANECNASQELAMEVGGVLLSPSFHYDVREHISFCFTCVGRSLEPELQAALLLREVDEMSNFEAAKALGLSESTFRHRLSDARKTMETAFDGLCALVNKRGVCYQCRGLRDIVPDARRQGESPPEPLSFDRRLSIVRECDSDAGRSQPLHDLFWRRIKEQEQQERGTTQPSAQCVPNADSDRS